MIQSNQNESIKEYPWAYRSANNPPKVLINRRLCIIKTHMILLPVVETS